MSLLAQIDEERRGTIAIARVRGEIDASNVKWLEGRLGALLTNRDDGLIVDLTATTYLDSAGIALLFALSSALGQHRQRLRLVVPEASPIARMARLTGLTGTVPTHPTVEAALAEP